MNTPLTDHPQRNRLTTTQYGTHPEAMLLLPRSPLWVFRMVGGPAGVLPALFGVFRPPDRFLSPHRGAELDPLLGAVGPTRRWSVRVACGRRGGRPGGARAGAVTAVVGRQWSVWWLRRWWPSGGRWRRRPGPVRGRVAPVGCRWPWRGCG